VSAIAASPAAGGSVMDSVRALQHTLYRTAKADPGLRFHALSDKVRRADVLERAWARVRANDGAPGIDRTTTAQVDEYGVTRLLDELAVELREGTYRPLPLRRALIPKRGMKDESRPLSIPAVRDRVVQTALKIVLEPVFEADMADCSFGFRPRRASQDALQVLVEESARGRRWVVETDIADCFTAIPFDGLMRAVEERVCDQPVLKLLRVILRGGVMAEGEVRTPVSGTSQGGPLSPLLCNIYLHRLDREWDESDGKLVRFADDLVVVCWSRDQAERALERLTHLLAVLGLRPKAAKTRIVHLQPEGEGFTFLGFHHRLMRSRGIRGRPKVTYLARWPSDRAMAYARDRIREITCRSRLLLSPQAVVKQLNTFLRGWAEYFRFGNSARRLAQIRWFASQRLARFIRARHRRSMGFGWRVMAISRPVDLGLISLSGITVPSWAGKPWREKPNAGGERRR